MPADLLLDSAAVDRDADRLVRRYLAAGTATIAGSAKDLERKLEDGTQRAVPGKLWRAWQSSAYPRTGPARSPVGTVWLKGGERTRGAFRFWTEPGAIRGKNGQFLAIPLPAAGSRGRARDLTPGEWERANGMKLRFVYRQGRASLLVADKAVLSGRGQVARANTARRSAAGRGDTTVPIFVLLPVVKHRNAFAIAPLVRETEGQLARRFFSEVQAARS